MSATIRRRIPSLLATLLVIPVGLATRATWIPLPRFVVEHGGDTLYAVLFVAALGVLVPGIRPWRRVLMAYGSCVAIELSQLYHAPWIDALRATTLGGLVLGFGFLWIDLLRYAVGVAACLPVLVLWPSGAPVRLPGTASVTSPGEARHSAG